MRELKNSEIETVSGGLMAIRKPDPRTVLVKAFLEIAAALGLIKRPMPRPEPK